MQTLLPAEHPARPSDSEPTDIHAHYAHHWLDQGGVRANFVSSIDGAISYRGKSRGLQTPGDNRVFAALRDLADVVLVGSRTARIEGYGPVIPDDARRAVRRRWGLPEIPAVAVVSASLELDLTLSLFSGADPAAPTLVVTGSAAPLHRRNDIIDLASSSTALELIEVPSTADGGVDLAAAITELRARGLNRILLEGGPSVMDSALRARVIDELCLTVSPMLVGPGAPRIVAGPEWPTDYLPQLRLTGLLAEDDALFCRYQVQS